MPVFELQTPDGRTFQVDAPDMNAAVQALQQGVPEPGVPDPAPQSQADPGRLNAFNVGVSQGVTANFGDELFAGILTPVEMAKRAITGEDAGKSFSERLSGAYDANLARERGELRSAEERAPVATTLGNVAGGLVTGGQLTKGGATLLDAAKPTYGSMIGRGAAEGALYGGAFGAGAGEGADDRLNKAVMGAAIGATTGGAMGAVGARTAAKEARAAIPSTDDLKAAASTAYKAADDARMLIKPEKFDGLVSDVQGLLKAEGFRPRLAPRAAVALEELQSVQGQALRLKDVDMIRRVVRNAAQSQDPYERRVGAMIVEKVDDWLGGITQADVLAGNATQGVKALTEARKLWSMGRKAEIIDDLMERARTNAPNYSASGYENALRKEFRDLAKNPKRMRGFTTAEKSAIIKVARGGPMENAMRFLGKFAPRGVVGTTLSGGAGYAAGGPVGAAALMGAGELGRRGATAMTASNANRVGDLIRSGGAIPGPQRIPANVLAMLEAMLQGTSEQAHRVPITGTSR